MNPEIDRYLEHLSQWQAESKRLRTILLSFPLKGQLKWGQPCYALQGKNIALIGGSAISAPLKSRSAQYSLNLI